MLTRQRDLRTGTPVWLTRGLPRLKIDRSVAGIAADVVVVGTGVSGALVADALSNVGLRVLAVDRRKPMSGSTSASTALLQGELDVPLTTLEHKIGKSDAARVWWRSAQAVQALRDRVDDLGIDCDYRPRSTLYLPGNVLGPEGLRREADARQKLGLRSAYIGRTRLREMSGIDKPGAILSEGNGEVDPVKLSTGVWRHFLKNGGRIVANIEVTDVEQTRSSVRLHTRDGQSIVAKHVVFCTGYEPLKIVRPRGFKVVSTWVLATKPQPARLWPCRSLIWEAADPYLYMRTMTDGRIIVGGEDEAFSDDVQRDKLIPQKIAAIARKAARIFPLADFEADYAWAGSFGESPTGLPAIGPVRGLSRCYAVLGFGGNGITFSMLAAQLVARRVQGLTDPDAELFRL
jgi:glycine/D-amino acid oxidase-like deaminating enzyme